LSTATKIGTDILIMSTSIPSRESPSMSADREGRRGGT
jgi:hypothetical protein